MSAKSFIDTNVLVYAFDSQAPDKQDLAIRILEGSEGVGELVLSTQVIQEFYVTVVRKLSEPLPAAQAQEACERMCKLPVVQVSPEMVMDAIALSREHQLSLWDGLILVSAHRGGCRVVLTEDLQDGFEWNGVRVMNPFTKRPLPTGVNETSAQYG